SVLLANGDGTFRPPENYTAGTAPTSVSIGDLNNDGNLDLVVANAGSGDVSVLVGNGDGTFQIAVNYGVGTNPESVLVGDFNGDGKLDLAVANAASRNISVLLGNGDGTFRTHVDYGVGYSAFSVAAGDFNSDGKLDLAIASSDGGSVSILLNTCVSAGIDLAIVQSNSTVTVSWPLPSTGFVLESTASLSVTNWQPAVETATTNNGRLEITAPVTQQERYFRLRKP